MAIPPKQLILQQLENQVDRLIAQNATLSQQFAIHKEKLDERFQNMVARFYNVQAAFHNSQRQCQHLQEVLQVKQQTIEVLLPYCTHPLTPELQADIALAA